MRTLQLIATGMTLLVAGCTDSSPLGPASSDREHQGVAMKVEASGARQADASGSFGAQVDFSTLTLTPRGQNCLLAVNGQLVFSGTIVGIATGTTEALVFAPCAEVLTTPPGTHPDVFRSELVFEGTINGEPATANLLYMGRVQPGGAIDGRLVFSNGVSGRLDAEGIVAVGGTYHGSVVVH